MKYSAKDISQRLADQAEAVCRHLLPNGKKNGAEYEVGSVDGQAGNSLKIRITGTRTGVWCDFASGEEKGDLLDLWRSVRRLNLGQAFKEAKDFLGIRDMSFEPKAKEYSRPKKEGFVKLKSEGPILGYLKQERKLTNETVNAFRVVEKNGAIAFPYLNPEGELIQVKYRAVAEKKFWSEANCAPCLFGWQAVNDDARSIAICEGEIDAMTLKQYGVDALSVGFGAGKGAKNDWIDYEWGNLERFDTIYLCYDSDKAGQSAIPEVSKRLGIHRCRIVTLPMKDANDCLKGGIQGEDIAKCFVSAKSISPKEIKDASEYEAELQEHFWPTSQKPQSFCPPMFGENIHFYPGEVTVWTGYSGHGKSALLGQIMAIATVWRERVAIASMEMKPVNTLARMVQQITAQKQPEPETIKKVTEALKGRVWIYEVLGNIKPTKLFECMEYSVARHNATHIIVDSLMKCAVKSDDLDAQKTFLNDLVGFAQSNNVHIHLVAHSRKGEDEKKVPGKYDVFGSSDITNQAHNIISVWRNKEKELELQKPGITRQHLINYHDAILYCCKQRESGWEGFIKFHFNPDSKQFTSMHRDMLPMPIWSEMQRKFADPGY